MRSALTILWVVVAGVVAGSAVARGDASDQGSGLLTGIQQPVVTPEGIVDASDAAKLTRRVARRWESAEHAVDVAAMRSSGTAPLTRNDVRSTELFRERGLASTMSLVEQASNIADRVDAWACNTPVRYAAELHRVREQQSDP